MLCNDFENRLTDYLDGALQPADNKMFAEHALRCPVCHDTLSAVKNSVQACRAAANIALPQELEARILLSTMPETAMTCEEFEDFLTDYLDGFLPAALFHRWERHAILCARCTELPGEVVRAIGTVNVYRGDELAVPAGLNERILQATQGTDLALEIRASLGERIASLLRAWLDPIVSPQLATVATMLLVAVFVLTNTVSADGSISGVYDASLRLAERSAGSKGVKDITNGLKQLVGGQEKNQSPAEQPKTQPRQNAAPIRSGRNRS
ncbi:MAG TPA: zf-HC2 domain-containing protein [Pyrinomonadaceae bacterium]